MEKYTMNPSFQEGPISQILTLRLLQQLGYRGLSAEVVAALKAFPNDHPGYPISGKSPMGSFYRGGTFESDGMPLSRKFRHTIEVVSKVGKRAAKLPNSRKKSRISPYYRANEREAKFAQFSLRDAVQHAISSSTNPPRLSTMRNLVGVFLPGPKVIGQVGRRIL
jgi:hypothetical protein